LKIYPGEKLEINRGKTMKHIIAIMLISLSFQIQAAAPGSAIGFELDSLEGSQKIKLSDYRGKVVFVDFWASWCVPCKKSLPEFNKVYHEFKDKGFEIVAINLDENPEDAKAFLKKHSVDYTIAADSNGKIAEKFGVEAMPSSVLIDPLGVIRINHKGYRKGDADKLKKAIKILLGEKS